LFNNTEKDFSKEMKLENYKGIKPQIEVAPSILNADLLHLEAEIQKIKAADWIHLDVMDGHFVPNLTFGPMFVAAIKPVTNLPIETHLMVDNPGFAIPLYAKAGSKRIIIHPENTVHLHRLIQTIKEYGCEAGVALNPATSWHDLQYVLADLDLVLVMTVNPGFGGQKLLTGVLPKLKKIAEIRQSLGLQFKIEVDGGVNWDNAADLVATGVDVMVAGTLIYRSPDPEAAIIRLKTLLNKGGNSTVL
jgi:ribulose-phosphate 3-epimerase